MKLLFVCTGNICRSPTAEGVMRHLLQDAGRGDVHVASAGTHGYHIGEAPDARSVATARERGVDISMQRAQKVTQSHFTEYDLLLALDSGHHHFLQRMAGERGRERVQLFLEYAGLPAPYDVPDPYYGRQADFDRAYDLVEAGCRGILARL